MKELNPIILLPVGVFSFLAGAAFGRSRKDFSMRSSSPLPGVPLVRWKRFVTIMAVTPKRHVTPRHRFGAFGLDARRLSDVGFMEKPHKTTIGGETGVWTGEWKRPLTTEKFLDSMPVQYLAFKRSMASMTPKVAGLVGTKIDGRECTLSGLLGVGHLAGEAGVESWVKNPDVRSRFKATTQKFTQTNEIF